MGALSFADDIEVVGVGEDGQTALNKINELNPDVVLLDMNLPGVNGLQVARKLRSTAGDTSIVILTAHHDDEQTLHAMRSGASAYCAKDVDADSLVSIIRAVAKGYFVVGDKYMSHNEYLNWLNSQLEDNIGYKTDADDHYIPLSPREMEILEYVTSGLINKEIASKLGISQQTVKNHMTSILKKLNVNDRTQAAILALRRGWVRLNDNQQEA